MSLPQHVDNVGRDLTPHFHPGIYVGQSPMHGRGVFSRLPIRAGDILMRLGGFLLPVSARDDALRSTAIGVSECVILAEVLSSERDISDYINHSCAPNSGFLDAITIVATEDIDTGQEITIDYAYWEFDSRWRLKQDCACGSAACRQLVTGADWRRSDIQERCLRWASPFVRRRIRQQDLAVQEAT